METRRKNEIEAGELVSYNDLDYPVEVIKFIGGGSIGSVLLSCSSRTAHGALVVWCAGGDFNLQQCDCVHCARGSANGVDQLTRSQFTPSLEHEKQQPMLATFSVNGVANESGARERRAAALCVAHGKG